MSSLAVRRYHSVELGDCIEEIEKKSNTGVKVNIAVGYRELEAQRGKCKARIFTVFSLAAATLCVYSSVILAYGSGKAYSEFENEGGLSNGGSSVGGHSAEWWPTALESAATAGLSLYFLYYKGKFHNVARLCQQKITQISQISPDKKELIEGMIDFSHESTEDFRIKLPFIGDDRWIVSKVQNEADIEDVEIRVDPPDSES